MTGDPGQVWYLIVSIPDLCLPLYFHTLCIIESIDTNTLICVSGQQHNIRILIIYGGSYMCVHVLLN